MGPSMRVWAEPLSPTASDQRDYSLLDVGAFCYFLYLECQTLFNNPIFLPCL